MKKQGHKLANFRPTSNHWIEFTKAVVKLRVFEEHLQLAGQQALWQFANVIAIMKPEKSTQDAKENSVFNLIYINFLRIVFAQLIQDDSKPVLSLDFMNKLAKTDENSMEEFVKKEFIPLVNAPSALGVNFPSLNTTWEACGDVLLMLYRKVIFERI